MQPSDFTNYPWGSVAQKSESETVALNIMRILKRTGNTFRPLSWEDYKEERLKDTGFSETERKYFDEVIGYCKSADTAVLFSSRWNVQQSV